MFITNFLFVDDPNNSFFMIADSIKFWKNSDYIMNNPSDILSSFKKTEFLTKDYRLFNFITLMLSYFAQLFDQNNILVQKTFNVFIGAFSIPYVYMILRKFFDKKNSFHYAIIYSLFSYTCIYSVVLFRDCHIYLLYTISFYLLIYYNKEKKVFLKLLVILILLLGLRLEHGLFFIVFIIAYFYLKAKNNKSILILFFFLTPILLAVIAPIILNNYQTTTFIYSERSIEENKDTNSTGSKLLKLPPVIRHVLMAINSQVAPAMPFWRSWYKKEENTHKYNDVKGYHTPWRFMEGVGAVFTLCTWSFIFIGYRLRLYSNVPKELKILFAIALLLLLTATTVINPRRIYCVYPILFIFSIYSYSQLPKFKIRKIKLKMFFVLAAVYLLLFFLGKGF
jgi:hypothetical protein